MYKFFTAPLRINVAFGSSGGRDNIDLNAAYSHGVSGTALAIRYMAQSADPVNELYVFADLTTGTRANISIACDIYNEHATSATQPGSTLRDSATAVTYPAVDDQWIKIEFGTPYTPAVGEVLWFVLYSTAAAPATDFPSILSDTNTSTPLTNRSAGFSTINGFTTAGTGESETPHVVKQGDVYFGQPITSLASNFTSSTRKRGIIVTPPRDVRLFEIESSSAQSTALNGIQIFESSQLPNDTPLHSYSLGSTSGQSRDEIIGAKLLPDLPMLTGGTTYYIVYTFASNTTVPAGGVIEDYSSYSSVFDALYDDFSVCGAVQDSGSNTWVISRNFVPNMVATLYDFPASAGGGGEHSSVF